MFSDDRTFNAIIQLDGYGNLVLRNGNVTGGTYIDYRAGVIFRSGNAGFATTLQIDASGNASLLGGFAPGNGVTVGAKQWSGSGVPSNGLGSDGDFYFRSDGTAAGHTVIYHKESGSWVPTGA